jgi:hypothetical protein
MPSKTHAEKRLHYITPENRAEIVRRAPRNTGHQGGGHPSVDFALNGALVRYFGLMASAMREVWGAIPDERDRAFIRSALWGVVQMGDDVTPSQMPLRVLYEIAEAAEETPDAVTPALLPALRRLGPLHGAALWDWMLTEKAAISDR